MTGSALPLILGPPVTRLPGGGTRRRHWRSAVRVATTGPGPRSNLTGGRRIFPAKSGTARSPRSRTWAARRGSRTGKATSCASTSPPRADGASLAPTADTRLQPGDGEVLRPGSCQRGDGRTGVGVHAPGPRRKPYAQHPQAALPGLLYSFEDFAARNGIRRDGKKQRLGGEVVNRTHLLRGPLARAGVRGRTTGNGCRSDKYLA